MQYLIDGHNLIPALGLRLSDPEDEEQLLSILQAFARGSKARLSVFFDGAPQANTRNLGAVKAIFVPARQTADEAIMRALAKAKSGARNLTVVSSDRQVAAAARAAHAAVISSQVFAAQVRAPRPGNTAASEHYPNAAELAEWEQLFSHPPENR